MGIEEDIKYIRNDVRENRKNLILIKEILNQLIQEKAPKDRSKVENDTKATLSVSDSKPVNLKINKDKLRNL